MACYECKTFLEHFKLATEWHAETLDTLEKLAISKGFSKSEIQEIKKQILTAHRDCLQAQEALTVHQATHDRERESN